MLSHREMVGLQAEKHDLIDPDRFASEEDYVLHLIHTAAYHQAAIIGSGKSVLDLGCNTGYGTEILSRTAARIVGVDVSSSAVDFANAKYGSAGLKFQLIDGQSLPFDNGEFDVIVSCQVVEHIVDHAQFIIELKRVLSPDGIVVITTPNAALRLDPGMVPWNPFHVREYLADELTETLSSLFAHVRVLGLFASERVSRIEVARVGRARLAARLENAPVISPASVRLRQLIKGFLPNPVLGAIRRTRDVFAKGLMSGNRASSSTYRLDEFFYQRENCHAALDLLALCSDSANEHAAALRTFGLD